jgi:hypothetical protein
VVADRETLRLRTGQLRQALRPGRVEVAAGPGADVAGDAPLPPAEVVGGGDVGEEREALLVAEVDRRLDEPGELDDERGLAVGLAYLDEAGYRVPAQLATPRSS